MRKPMNTREPMNGTESRMADHYKNYKHQEQILKVAKLR